MKQGINLYRLFFSYFLLSALVCIFGFASNYFYTTNLKREVDQKIFYRGKQVLGKIEECFITYKNLSAQIDLDRVFAPDVFLSSLGNKYSGIQKLQEIVSYNSSLQMISLYYGGDEFYTISGFVHPNVFLKTTLSCSVEDIPLGLTVIESNKAEITWLDCQGRGFLLLHFPVFFSAMAEKRYYNYFLNQNEFFVFFEPLLDMGNVQISISFGNREGGILLEGNVDEGFRIVSGNRGEHSREFIKKFNVFSDLLQMNLSVAYIEGQIYMETNRWWWTGAVSLAFLFTATAAGTFFLSLIYYNKISGTAFFLKQQTMNLLIHGIIKSEDVSREIMDALDVKSSCFTVVCILFGRHEKNVSELFQLFQKKPTKQLFCKIDSGGFPGLVTVYLLPDKDIRKAGRIKITENLKNDFANIRSLRIGFSRVYEDMTMISHAYIEALSAAENLASETRSIKHAFFDSIINPHNFTVQFSQNNMLLFENSLQKRDYTDVVNAFEKLKQDMAAPQISEANMKYLRYLIIQAIIMNVKTMKDSGELLHDVLLIDPEDESKFTLRMETIFRRICPNALLDEFEKVLKFINENYTRPELSLDEVAAFMGFSRSYMSRLFKEKTGCRYIEYIAQLRLEKAKELLLTTDLPIKAIPEMVGYYNLAGFREKFKKTFGVSASEFRKNPG